MRRKVLQDLANTLCQMVVGWRMVEDLERVAGLPDGTLSFDLLQKRVRHDSGGELKLWITGELAAWLQARLIAEAIDSSKLLSAELEVRFKVERRLTNRQRIVVFDFDCRSVLATDEREYRGTLVERHEWHRKGDAKAGVSQERGSPKSSAGQHEEP